MIRLIEQHVSKIAIAVVIGSVSLAHAGYAADSSTTSTTSTSGSMTKPEDGMKRVDERIKSLHDELNITAGQEPQWNKVAQIMRSNETSVHKLVEARHENESANAIDDLKSYEKITEAHERGLKKLIPAFETFYNGLTAEQKTTADGMFGRYEGRVGDKSDATAAPADSKSDNAMDKETNTPPDNGTASPGDTK